MSTDDLLFRNRNRNYGAYKLRKQYKAILALSFLITLLIAFFVFVVPLLLEMKEEVTDEFVIHANITPAELTQLNDLEEPEPEKPKDQPKKEEPDLIPKADSTEKVRNDSLEAAKINHIKDSLLAKANAEKANGNDNDPRLKGDAVFNCGGDLGKFRSWFMENFKYPTSARSKKMEGKIVLQFMLNKRGLVDSVKIVQGIDPEMDNEAKKVILNSPRWNPCVINGKTMKIVYLFPVFIVPHK